MYLLRDENDYDFISLIDSTRILTTRELREAIIFDDIEKAKKLKDYIELENEHYDLEIVTIQFEKVKE